MGKGAQCARKDLSTKKMGGKTDLSKQKWVKDDWNGMKNIITI